MNAPGTHSHSRPYPSPASSYNDLGRNPFAAYPNPYALSSQHSLVSDSGRYSPGGLNHDYDQYAEDIPLKSHAQYTGVSPAPQQNWMHQPTQYAPVYPQPIPEPLVEPPQPKRRRRGIFGFRGKIPWVTYILTIVQIAVFIVELVKNCKVLLRNPLENRMLTDMSHSSTNRITHPNQTAVQSYDRSFSICDD